MKIDFKRHEKQYYNPTTQPTIIDIPKMKFLTVYGSGNPNDSVSYKRAIEILYGLSYTIKMHHKHILDYVVPPLEGYWHVDDSNFKGPNTVTLDKSKFIWQMMLRQPDFVTEKIVQEAKHLLSNKKPQLDLEIASLEEITEGLVVQIMHIGAYDDESESITKMDAYALEQGYKLDLNDLRRHHEIYISDPRKTQSHKLKTIIRHPIRK